MADLEHLVPAIGGLAWIAGRLFELEGRWAEAMADPAAVLHLAEHSRHHGWHVELWQGTLPDSPALAAADHVRAPAGWAEAFDRAEATTDHDAARLACLYRVLVPRLAGLLGGLQAGLIGPGDAAIARTAGFVIADVDRDLRGGSARLAATLGDDEGIQMAASATLALDQAFRIT